MESHYKKLGFMVFVDAILMFLLMYSMIDTFSDLYPNLNQAYMALIMVAPMALAELLIMKSMFQDKKLNLRLFALFSIIFLGAFFLMRSQTGIGDKEFLRSMIPHHSGAILMCERSSITDPEIVKLCQGIVQSQKEEIAQMKAILKRY